MKFQAEAHSQYLMKNSHPKLKLKILVLIFKNESLYFAGKASLYAYNLTALRFHRYLSVHQSNKGNSNPKISHIWPNYLDSIFQEACY